MSPVLIIAVVLLAAAALFFALVYILFRIAFYNKTSRPQLATDLPKGLVPDEYTGVVKGLIESLYNVPYESEDVYITSRDGLELHAKYYNVCAGSPVDICIHGYRGVAARDFCGGAQLAMHMGHNVLLVDQRAQGRSGGSVMTMGIKERFDCVDWANYASERFGNDVDIYLYGISMGAASVLMAASLGLPANVKGIVADCGYTSPAAILRKVISVNLKLPEKIVYPVVKLGAKLFGKFNLEEADALTAVSSCNIPLLIIHGEEDRLIPCSMSRELYETSGGRAQLITVPGAGHGTSYLFDASLYSRTLREFTSTPSVH